VSSLARLAPSVLNVKLDHIYVRLKSLHFDISIFKFTCVKYEEIQGNI